MLRLGIVDFDSSHSIEFTRRFNHVGVSADQCVERARVVVGCPGSSEMAPERIPGFQQQIVACGVRLVDQAQDMIGDIDAVLILSLCGAAHLESVRPFLEAGVPAFVDKPFTCSVAHARSIIELAKSNNTLMFNSSALCYSADVVEFRNRTEQYGAVHGTVSYGPAKREKANPGLFHYGIHPTEVLLTLMGPGCEKVSTAFSEGAELVTARWKDGRVATLRGNRQGATTYGFIAFCENAVIHQPMSTQFAYRNLCRAMVESFESGKPAVENSVSLEVVKFITASLESERRNGEAVSLDSVDSETQ